MRQSPLVSQVTGHRPPLNHAKAFAQQSIPGEKHFDHIQVVIHDGVSQSCGAVVEVCQVHVHSAAAEVQQHLEEFKVSHFS